MPANSLRSEGENTSENFEISENFCNCKTTWKPNTNTEFATTNGMDWPDYPSRRRPKVDKIMIKGEYTTHQVSSEQ